MKPYDVAFIGHMSHNQIIPYKGTPKNTSGGAVFFAAMTAAVLGKRTALVTKFAEKDASFISPLKEKGVDVFVLPAKETSQLKIIHPSENMDLREIFQEKSAGPITREEMPEIRSRLIHLCPVTGEDFAFDLLKGLQAKGYPLSIDMQGSVRFLDPVTGKIHLRDNPSKKEMLAASQKVKLDVVEAGLLTGTDHLEKAASTLEKWGSRETMITRSDGVFLRHGGKTYFEKFSNRHVLSRTGRGDTTFSAYICRRMDHDVSDSLKFAAALASIKLENPGPFHGTVDDVLLRMKG